jgi:hypothetical protein
MDNPHSPQQQATETQSYRSPKKNHGGQHVICGDSDAHRQTDGTSDIVAGFQTGLLARTIHEYLLPRPMFKRDARGLRLGGYQKECFPSGFGLEGLATAFMNNPG